MAKATNTTKKNADKSATASKQKVTDKQSSLLDFFKDEIKDIYWAEQHLVKMLPKMKKATTSKELGNAIGEHLDVTKTHVTRLEQIFELLGEKPKAKKCEAMEGISKEGESIIEDTDDGTATRDVGIIMASQKVEHYEIATYGGLKQLATTLGLSDIAKLLEQTLNEEKEADDTLTGIAENNINYEAASED